MAERGAVSTGPLDDLGRSCDLRARQRDGAPCRVLPLAAEQDLARETSASLLDIERAALASGILPERYLRNTTAFSLTDQLALLGASVLVCGLGGLGGYVVELLARVGVGTITGADGDRFEPSNLNRQLLATSATLESSKAEAAAERVALVNEAVIFRSISHFLDKDGFAAAIREAKADLVVDALGGLAHRLALQQAASEADLPLTTAALAGFSGYAGVVFPGRPGPANLLGAGDAGAGVEETLGSPGPTAALAASLLAQLSLQTLTKKVDAQNAPTLVFDLADLTFEQIRLA